MSLGSDTHVKYVDFCVGNQKLPVANNLHKNALQIAIHVGM